MGHPIVEHRLELDGVKTRALELDGDGVPIVLLHGFADSADCWRLVLDRIRRAGRPAVALDMPGFGAASRLEREPAPILPQLDAFVTAAVSKWAGGRGVVLAGNSLGGLATLRAAQNPDLPIAAAIPVAPAGLDLARWISIIQREPLIRGLLASPAPVPAAVVRNIVGRSYRVLAFAHPRSVDARAVASFASHFTGKRDAIRILGTARRLLPEIRKPFDLERIECPTLVVWGDRDRMVPNAGAQKIIDQVPGARLELLAGVGHCPQVEAPDELAELLLGFPGEAAGDAAPAATASGS